MAAFIAIVLLAGSVSGSYIRYSRDSPGSSSSSSLSGTGSGAGSGSGAGYGSGSGAFSGSSSSSFSSSSGTKVAPGPGGYGNFNAFSGMSNFSPPPFGGNSQSLFRGSTGGNSYNEMGQLPFGGGSQSPFTGGAGGSSFSQTGQFPFGGGTQSTFTGGAGGSSFGQQPFGFPAGFNPYVPQYGQQYPWVPFPTTFAAPFDFMSFLNQYFQSLQNFQAQAEAQAQQAANSGHGVYNSFPGGSTWAYAYPRSPLFGFGSGGLPIDTNEVGGVGGVAMATYGPQGGYGSANIFPKPDGGLETRFGGEEEVPQNSVGGGPVSSVGGKFKPPGGSSFGVFTSSASGSSDINGKKTSFKQSSIGINDNGKVTTYTAHDP